MMASTCESSQCANYVVPLDQKVSRNFDKASFANFSPLSVLNQTSFAILNNALYKLNLHLFL